MLCNPAISVVCALAATASTAMYARSVEFSADAGVAALEGTSYERVYSLVDYGALNGRYHRLSELIWDLEGIYGVRASTAMEFARRFELRGNVFSAFTEGSGGMVDYDWFLYDRPNYWTHRSRSTVKVRNALDIDLRGTLRFVRTTPLSLNAMLGWRYMNFRWEDRGIDYVYSSLGTPGNNPDQGYSYEQEDPGAVRDLADVDTRVGILYEQTFHIPYVGLSAELRRGKLRAAVGVLYSPITTVQDEDRHLLRGLVFDGTFVGGTYLAWNASLTYKIFPHLFVSASYESQQIDEFRGDMDVSDGGGTYLGTLNNGASVEHVSRQASVTVGVTF